MRLFKELEARNRDLTATGEILQVISRSPTDVQPVFDTIVRSAGRLCEATFSAVALVDGDELTLGAAHGLEPEAMAAVLRGTYPRPLARDLATSRAVLERRVVHIPDVQADREYHNRLQAEVGIRTVLAVPMLREGVPIGAIGVWRHEMRPFTDNQLALLQTFADQAVIAIENVQQCLFVVLLRLPSEPRSSSRRHRSGAVRKAFANALKAARQLGHTDATTMLRWYARWLPRPGKRAVGMLDDALGRAIVVLGEAPSGTVGSQSGV